MVELSQLVLHDVGEYGGPPTLVAAQIAIHRQSLIYAAIFVFTWALIVGLFAAAGFGTEICGVRRGTWALKSAMLLHHAFVTPAAFFGMWQDAAIFGMFSCLGCGSAAPLMNRDSVPCMTAKALTPVTLGYFMGDLLLLSQWNLKAGGRVENLLMLFHHLASLLVWPCAVYFDWVSRYVIIMLSYEFTSFWLVVLWMLSSAGLKDTLWYKLAGLIFTLSFVLIRMVGALPQFRAMYLAPPWSQALEHAAQPGGIHDWCWIFSASLVAPHLINAFWGFKVVSGFMAVFTKKKSKSKPS
jgi:hypothetical protein